MILLAGLGNPGAKYDQTRHNVGFMAVDEIVHRFSFGPWRSKFQAQVCDGTIDGVKVMAIKPETFMNNSGIAISQAMQFYKISITDLFVLYDELDLTPGKLRTKKGGGNGGHNGLRSIDAHCGKEYWRARIGIGHPGNKAMVTSYVLHKFSGEDHKWLDKLLPEIANQAPLLIKGEDNIFTSNVMQALAPPRPPKPPRPETPNTSNTQG